VEWSHVFSVNTGQEGHPMPICADRDVYGSLDLPDEFEDLTGVLQADLRVIVNALTQRATDRLLLNGKQAQQFQRKLWGDLARSIDRAVQPLDPNRH
jgi:hypothetical protein